MAYNDLDTWGLLGADVKDLDPNIVAGPRSTEKFKHCTEKMLKDIESRTSHDQNNPTSYSHPDYRIEKLKFSNLYEGDEGGTTLYSVERAHTYTLGEMRTLNRKKIIRSYPSGSKKGF